MIAGRCLVWFGVMAAVMLTASACTTGVGKSDLTAGSADETTSQPSTATYSCADGGLITIENLGASVRISGAGDERSSCPHRQQRSARATANNPMRWCSRARCAVHEERPGAAHLHPLARRATPSGTSNDFKLALAKLKRLNGFCGFDALQKEH